MSFRELFQGEETFDEEATIALIQKVLKLSYRTTLCNMLLYEKYTKP